MTHSPTELIPFPERGRVYTHQVWAGLADCAPSGRARLDALARWLQDAAFADVEDAGLADRAVWVVRRKRIKVERFPRFAERLTLKTFCSGIGRAWAERRTSIIRDGEPSADVEAVSLWVHLDPGSRRPTHFSAAETAVYTEAAGGRTVTARLRHPSPAQQTPAATTPWSFRHAETDLADHINNSAYWIPLLEEGLLTTARDEPKQLDVELEFRRPADPGEKQLVSADHHRWLLDGDGERLASLRIHALAY